MSGEITNIRTVVPCAECDAEVEVGSEFFKLTARIGEDMVEVLCMECVYRMELMAAVDGYTSQ